MGKKKRNRKHKRKQKGGTKMTKMTHGTKITTGGCHTGSILVGTFGGVTLWAGGDSRKGGWWTLKPYPDLAIGPKGHVDRPRFASSQHDLPEGFEHLAQHFGDDANEEPSKVIALDWPDFSVPKDTPPEFWHALRDEILKQGLTNVYCMCMGGHGRTGISLSILIHLLATPEERQWTDYAGLLAWVHENYCDQAVEGEDQAQYAADACGLDLGDVVINHYRGGGGTAWSGWQGGYSYGGGANLGKALTTTTATSHTFGKTKCHGCGVEKQRKVMETVLGATPKDDIWLCVPCYEDAGDLQRAEDYEKTEQEQHDALLPRYLDEEVPKGKHVQCYDCDVVWDADEYITNNGCQMCLSQKWLTLTTEGDE